MFRIIEIDEFELDNIVVKEPHITSTDKKTGNPIYSSEIWYVKSGEKPFRPILKTPRLRVRYGCKPTPNGKYSYCISTFNSDIDKEISDFFIFIRALDRKISLLSREKQKKYSKFNYKYWSSIKRVKNEGILSEGYINLYLISESVKTQSNSLTKINDYDTGSPLDPTDIVYGCYTDQLISLNYICYDTNGVKPLWFVHQIVVSKMEKIFLEHCLLGELNPQHMTSIPPPPPPPPPHISALALASTSSLASASTSTSTLTSALVTKVNGSVNAPSIMSLIKPDQLKQALNNLKSTPKNDKPKKTENSDELLISAEKLQQRKKEITQKVHEKLIFDSAKIMDDHT